MPNLLLEPGHPNSGCIVINCNSCVQESLQLPGCRIHAELRVPVSTESPGCWTHPEQQLAGIILKARVPDSPGTPGSLFLLLFRIVLITRNSGLPGSSGNLGCRSYPYLRVTHSPCTPEYRNLLKLRCPGITRYAGMRNSP